ncbi:MAG: FGGY-family carbohydrate kinase [Candidatus Jordarchaeales archaeon]
MAGFVVAWDFGTSSVKSVVCTTEGEVVGSAVAGYELYHPQPGWAEQNPKEWWAAVSKSTREAVEAAKVKVKDVEAVSISAQMAGLVPIDRNGEPLRPAIIWLDNRAEEQAKRLAGNILSMLLTFIRITGGAPGPKDVISKIVWLKENEPHVFEKAYKFLDAKDYLVFRLTGKYYTSWDCANVTWMFDSRKGKMKWSESICGKAGIPLEKLCEPVPSPTIVGELTAEAARDLGLKEGTPVVCGCGDITAATVGSGAVREKQVHAYIGTSSWVVAPIRDRKLSIRYYIGSICSADPTKYILVGEQECSGACYQWLRNNLGYKYMVEAEKEGLNAYKVMDRIAAEAEPGSKKLIFTPWMYGERSPLNDHTVRGGFINLSLTHGEAHVLRAILEGVAYHMRWILEGVQKLIGRVPSINIIGGGAQSDLWCQIIADVTGSVVRQMKDPLEAGSRGAALTASVALGYYKSFDELEKVVPAKREFEPNQANREIYDELYLKFKLVYKKLKKMYRELNK